MTSEKVIIGIFLMGIGLLFFFNNINIAKGAFKFYKKLYTENNLKIMFKAAGILLVIGGLIIILTK